MIVDDLEDGAGMFHRLCSFDRHVFSFVYHGSVRRKNDMEGNRQISAVINGRIMVGCLFFIYTPVCSV